MAVVACGRVRISELSRRRYGWATAKMRIVDGRQVTDEMLVPMGSVWWGWAGMRGKFEREEERHLRQQHTPLALSMTMRDLATQ